MTQQLYVPTRDRTRALLDAVAALERRTAREQAAYLLERAVTRAARAAGLTISPEGTVIGQREAADAPAA